MPPPGSSICVKPPYTGLIHTFRDGVNVYTPIESWEDQKYVWAHIADRRKTIQALGSLAWVGEGAGRHLQHKDLWFEDGNVVIIAKNVWFKLYRGILAKYSTVFHSMFQVADMSAGDSVQGCPVVNLTDNPEHLVEFFILLCDGARKYVGFLAQCLQSDVSSPHTVPFL